MDLVRYAANALILPFELNSSYLSNLSELDVYVSSPLTDLPQLAPVRPGLLCNLRMHAQSRAPSPVGTCRLTRNPAHSRCQ